MSLDASARVLGGRWLSQAGRERHDHQTPDPGARGHGVSPSTHWDLLDPSVTLTFTNPLVQQHCACPPPTTPEASFAVTRST